MKRTLLVIALLLMFGAFAAAQAPSIPTCDGYNTAGDPIATATGSTVCTDYFGAVNWANSPLPTGSIVSFTLLSGGSGYVAPSVVITDVTGSGASATVGPLDPTGAITSVTLGNAGTNYMMPVVTIVDTNCGLAGQLPCGSGAMVTANIGGTLTGGMRKFQDALPDLKRLIATADTTTFPGSDFYVIGLGDYTTQMHADLPATKIRGYCQLANAAATSCGAQSYLGPIILAQKDRPVRVLFKNLLPAGAGGNLFIPVDTTYMGAGDGQNRATLHLHGGATPWISDGTPHQWTKPNGDVPPTRGVSTAFVPDMWFLNGAVVPAGTPGATNDPGAGNMTFFWTNAQGGRLMFYHDHAYGLTRLNVYAGEAAGYLLYDSIEETTLGNAGAPGSITAGDLAHLIPLVIQDKTFVPSAAQMNATDPTWGGSPNGFGASALSTAANGNGDLWLPHVYMPNQNPNDPMTGASGFGHWDYGAWFFPPMTTLTAGPNGGVTVPCASSVAGGQTWQCPIIPNPSGTPESFMDTPVVNGKAYPVLHVAPEAYRFKILSAANDRSWNLSWFVADPTQSTEVVMVPALPPVAGAVTPLCTTITPVAVPPLVLGLTTGLLDTTGNPLNGTGLPAGCWPNYGPQAGIPNTQAMWAGDGRAGGVPDPRTAGPAWIQLGSEGGLLPAPVVIPPTPVNYEQNTRSITIGSVAMHGLWLGTAERADVIVDFSKFAGKTLILYNDAPAPAPASDSRLDYFTGDGDQTPIGGAPNTLPGYGPNTRTVMQVIVDAPATGTGKPLNLPALRAAFATTAQRAGVFAATQPTIIVPEPGYNSTYNKVFPSVYMGIHDNSMTFSPILPLTFESLLGPEPSTCTTVPLAPAQCASYNQKTIQELFTLDYGRMNATLGTELPLTNFQNQTTIPLGYVDPATEIVRQGDTQLWKITHNGVDTHFIHFHLFNVQVVNRVGWDGSVRQPDANELGWKETVRMNPLEDIMVALQPITPPTPWPIPNSVRLNDVTGSTMNFSNLNPFNNGGTVTQDGPTNFGWEYVWHCHILGHEENDMMRPILWQVPPPTPGSLTAVADTVNGGVKLTWTDNSASETGFIIQRDIDPAFPSPATINAPASPTRNGVGEGTDWGTTQTINDNASLIAGQNYYYRAQAIDDGFKAPFEQSYNVTSALLSTWSNTAQILPAPIAGISATALAFGNVTVGSSTQTLANGQLAQVTISNSGNADLTLAAIQTGSTDFSSSASGCVTVAPGSTCVFNVTYSPSVAGPSNATITFTTNDPAHPTLGVSMTGTGVVTSAIAINAPTVTYNANGVVTVTVSGTPNTFTPTGNVTLAVDGGAPISQALAAGVSTFTITAPNAGNHTLLANYAAQNGFLASSATGTLTINPAALSIAPTPNPATMTYGGSLPILTPSYSGFVTGEGPTNLTGTASCTTTATATSPVGAYTSVCSGATSTNYAISYPQGVVNVGKATSTPTITSNKPSPAIIGQIVTVSFNVAPQFSGTPSGNVTVTASTGETCSGALTGGAGSCTLTFATGGSRTLTATYAGDGNFLASGPSAAVTQVVSNISLSSTSLLFGNQTVGTRSAAQTVTLSNVGTTTLTISGITWSTNFSDSTNCGTTLLAGRSCRINVVFAPTTTGVLTGVLTITDSDVTSPQVVTLTGTGIQAAAVLSPASYNFGTQARRTTSAPFTFTLTNTGNATMNINSIGLGGANPSQFIITSRTCGNTLAVGATCNINVAFAPTGRQAYSAILRVSDTAPNSPQTATLTGTGQ